MGGGGRRDSARAGGRADGAPARTGRSVSEMGYRGVSGAREAGPAPVPDRVLGALVAPLRVFTVAEASMNVGRTRSGTPTGTRPGPCERQPSSASAVAHLRDTTCWEPPR